jgi:GT2 family glycosyltransferase
MSHDLPAMSHRTGDRQPRVLIVVLCYNGVADTVACLESLQRLDYPRADVLIVDNASQDGTPAIIRDRFPDVQVLETGANLGYAAGNNAGLRYALDHGYDYALLLNNDTIVESRLISALVEATEADSRIGVVGPKILYHDRPDVIWSAGGLIDWRRGTSAMRGLDSRDHGQFDESLDMDFVTGCALMIRRAAIESAGLIDERFGMYYEETEWCVRIARAGWRIVYAPEGKLWHKIKPNDQDWSPRVTYYMARNRLLFLRLTRAPLRAWLHALILQDLRTWTAWRLRRRWRGRAAQRKALRAAWIDFARQRFGMV